MHANIEGWPDTVLAMPSSACTLSGTSSSCRHSVSSCRHSIELSCPEHTFWSLNARHRSQLPCHTNPCPERSQHPNCNQALSVKGLASLTPVAAQQVAALHSPEALQTARAASITLTASPLYTSRLFDGHKCSPGLTLPTPADAHCGSITVQVTRVWVDSGARALTAAPFLAGPRRSAGGGQAGGHRCRPGSLRHSHRAGRPHHQQRVRHSDVPVRWRGRLGHRLQAAPGRPAIGATQDTQR